MSLWWLVKEHRLPQHCLRHALIIAMPLLLLFLKTVCLYLGEIEKWAAQIYRPLAGNAQAKLSAAGGADPGKPIWQSWRKASQSTNHHRPN